MAVKEGPTSPTKRDPPARSKRRPGGTQLTSPGLWLACGEFVATATKMVELPRATLQGRIREVHQHAVSILVKGSRSGNHSLRWMLPLASARVASGNRVAPPSIAVPTSKAARSPPIVAGRRVHISPSLSATDVTRSEGVVEPIMGRHASGWSEDHASGRRLDEVVARIESWDPQAHFRLRKPRRAL